MDFKTHLKLRAANDRLPANSFFAYQGTEIFDFRNKPSPGFKMVTGRFIHLSNIKEEQISFHFDQKAR